MFLKNEKIADGCVIGMISVNTDIYRVAALYLEQQFDLKANSSLVQIRKHMPSSCDIFSLLSIFMPVDRWIIDIRMLPVHA